MLTLEVDEYEISRDDYNSTLGRDDDVLTLTINYEMQPTSPGEVVFGDLSFGHLQAEPWADGEFAQWRERWEALILQTFDRAFELEVYTGGASVGLSRVELTLERNWRSGGTRVAAGYRYMGSSESSWSRANNQDGGAIVPCRLVLNQVQAASGEADPAVHVHLRVRVAKGRARARRTDTPYQGVEIAAGGTTDDIDMLLLSSDLEPRATPSGAMQTRALLEFGRYLGCWSLGADGGADLMAGGDVLRAWHGWPWWRRFGDHVDASERRGDSGAGSGTQYASVVVIRLASTGERSRATEIETDIESRSEQEQQANLRDQSPQIPPEHVALGVLLGVVGGALLAVAIGAAYAIAVHE